MFIILSSAEYKNEKNMKIIDELFSIINKQFSTIKDNLTQKFDSVRDRYPVQDPQEWQTCTSDDMSYLSTKRVKVVI